MELLTVDEKVKNKEDLIQVKSQAGRNIAKKLQKREFDRRHIREQLRMLLLSHKDFMPIKRDAIRYLQGALDEYNHVDELQKQIKSLSHGLRSGRNTLLEEKQILRQIKCAQEQKEKFCADLEAKNWSHWHLPEVLNSKEFVKSHFNRLYNELEGGIKQQTAYYSKAARLGKKLSAVERDISSLQKKLEKLECKREKMYEHLQQLRSSVQNPS
ncbi:uncharacterized protein [Coffea arabica]|uniref:Uncharacterized protein n=1 Tax=Coffea arabica TaxID=13443 RepID=A0ABM4VT17_COFAR|nr:uncharacterized protein LOC113709511 [Coffea arabica]